jgi:outer membrane receptor protein involved in Fe transport
MKAPRIIMPLHSATAFLAAAFLLLSVPARAQTAAATPDQLAKYDKNHNGKLDPDEVATMQADQARGLSSTTAPAPVELSPFVVDTTQEKGYFAPSTLAGTRLNTNIGDLPSSITVVTKQQMEDTNSLNINDVFRYESNTEGARTYTPFTTVRSNITDSNGSGGGTTGNYTSALDTGNRIRGLAAADQNEDNFFSLYRIPFDAYNTASVEIDRGPNSLIFGTGSPAGIVNQSRIQATLEKFSAETQLEMSSWGGYRESVGLNIPLKKDVLAIYVAQLYDSQGFKEKPSADISRRQYVAFNFVPFKNHKTKLTGSFENYNNYANDPNYITPIDAVTPWLQSGRPVYNQVTSMVTYLNTGVTTGPYALSTTAPNYVPGGALQANLATSTSPFFVPAMQYFTNNHNIQFWDQGHLENFYKGQQIAGSVTGPAFSPTYASLTPAQQLIYGQRPTYSATLPPPALANGTAKYTIWYLPGLVNKGIYDWSTLNINSLDVHLTRAKT